MITIRRLLYPATCPLCRKLLGINEGYVCEECDKALLRLGNLRCLRCGADIDEGEEEYCSDCSCLTRSYIRGFPALRYEGKIKECLYRFKYAGKKQYARFLARQIVKECGRDIISVSPDALVPVPVHASKFRQRGYNQAALLAKELSKLMGIPCEERILERKSKTAPQKKLSTEAREKNLKNAFNSTVKSVEYRKIMLVDDIYTTGATIESCTQVLLNIGVKEIYYTSVCIGKGFS